MGDQEKPMCEAAVYLALHIGFFVRGNGMADEKKKTKIQKIGIAGIIILFGIKIADFLGGDIVYNVFSNIYSGWFAEPQIKCIPDGEILNFSVDRDFRSIMLHLRPQVVVQFDDYIILLIYVNGYFENEIIHFDQENTCKAKICRKGYTQEIQKYIEQEVIESLLNAGSGISRQELDDRINIYISTVAGVSYETKNGNYEKRLCIIETSGIVSDYDEHSKTVKDRLYDVEYIITKEDSENFRDDEKIALFINTIADEISALY